MIPEILNTVGLSLDIAGVWLVAYEFLLRREPQKSDVVSTYVDDKAVPEKLERERKKFWWERNIGKWGLALLTLGFILQGVAAWLPTG